jgi:uracil-DNA glycosylase family 4
MSLTSYGFSPNLVEPDGSGANRVMIIGEAPGAGEDATGIPFHPSEQSGSVLARAMSRIGSRREQFVITNVVPWRPPNNVLKGPHYAEAVAEGRVHLEAAIATYKPKAILALGAVATQTTTGLAGDKLGVSQLCGYVLPSLYGPPVVVCFHPSYLRRGKMSHMSVLMRALRLAIKVASEGLQAVLPTPLSPPVGYITHPTREQAESYLLNSRGDWLVYDCETFYSNSDIHAVARAIH